MLVRALIRPVGKISLATSIAVLTLATATAATSQTVPAGVIDNTQDQAGAVSATQTLDVVQNDGLTQAESAATGNALHTGNDAYDATLYSFQFVHGNVTAEAHINGTNTGDEDLSLGTPVYATTQAMGNYADGNTKAAHLTSDTTQKSDAAQIVATTEVSAPNNAIYVSGEGNATVEANHTAYEVSNGRLDSKSWQTSSSDVNVNTSATVHYSPSVNAYNASATQNYYGAYSGDRGSQEHDLTQDQTGTTQSRSEVYAGNVWNMTANSTAVANTVNLENTGGSLAVTNNQTQGGAVQSQGFVQADEYGTVYATATGIGNQMAAGNNDVTLRVDNTQIASGGVDVSSEFEGNVGYDAYVTAEATGNSALGYACSECQADMGVVNNQTNNGDINATATASVARGRSVVSTARATGNSATYYVGN